MIEPTYLKRSEWKNIRRALDARIAAAEGEDRVELLRRLATLFEEQLEDYNAALETMAKVLHEDLLDESVWAELERLARVASSSKRLADIFSSELSELPSDDEKSARLAKRTGQIYAELGDSDAALKWFRRVHAFEPESREMFEAIDTLLVKENRHEERVALYRAAYDHRDGEEKLALLHTVAELEEKQLGRLEDAVETHRAALDVDPDDTVALDQLTALYQRLERHRDLADHYLRRAEAAPSAEAAAPYRLALARLDHGTLKDTEAAIDQLEAIVTEVPWNKEAIAELEALSTDAEHKARVVEILRPLYERADEWMPQVRLNKERLSMASDPRDKASILKETSKLLETRGQVVGEAFEAMREAFDFDPADSETRSELERLAKAVGGFDRLAESYERAAERISEDFEKRELLAALARVYDSELDDPRRALNTTERLFLLDPTEQAPLASMDDLAVLLGDWPKVIEVLEKKADNAADSDAADIHRRIARTKQEMLDDWLGASTAYERALTLDADHADTVDRLVRLYEDEAYANPKSTSNGASAPDAVATSQRLVELYGRRVELAGTGDAELRYDLNVRAGKRLEEVLKNPREAIVSFNAALEAKPGDTATLLSLERLLRSEKAWHELLENLQTQAGLAGDVEGRTEKRIAIGNLYLNELESPEDALEQFRLVLDEKPDLAEPQTRVIEIAKAREDLRLQAAEVVLPVLRAQGKHAERVEVLELKLTSQDDPGERAGTLREIAGILEESLQKDDDALGALLRALADTPDDASLHGEIERLAEKITAKGDAEKPAYGRYADALDARGKDQADAGIAKGLYVRLGRIAEEKLADQARAVEAYKRAVDHAGDEADLLEALDRLYVKLGEDKELADVLERRVAISSEKEQAELLYRLAKIQLEKQNEAAAGLGSLRAALEKDPSHVGAREAMEALTDNPTQFEEAAETLENVYRQSGDNAALARLYEKRIKYAPTSSERIRMRLDLSKVLEDRSNDPEGALKVLLGALGDDPTDSDVLAEIERLATMTSSFRAAAEALEAAIKAHDDVTGEPASDLWIRAAGWRKDKVQDLEGAEKDFTEALAHDAQNVVILRALEEIQRAPGREKDLVATLRRIAKIEGSSVAADLRKEAKGLAERVEDDALAEAILREMVAADDADVWALTELTKKREKAEDYKETYALLVRRAELAAEGDVIRELRHEAAAVASEKLKDTKSAIELLESIFEDSPTDERAPKALRALYESTGKKKELLKLLERLIDVADGVSRRSELRIEAAQVSEELDAPSEAIDHLRAALDDEPTQKEATLALSRLLEKTGRDEELAELLNTQIELAEKRSDKDAELSYRVRLGEVYESRLGNVEKAIETFKTVLERDDKNFGALMALARLEENKGSKEEAAKVLERALEVAPKDQAVGIAKRLTQMFEGLKDLDGKRRALERGLTVQNDEPELRDKLRGVYEAQKAYPELAKLITEDARAATEVPEKVRRLRAAADIHSQKLSDAATAATLLAEASELVPNDRELLLILCDAYSASGRAKEALGVLQKIVDSFGGRRAKELAPIHHRLAKAYLADGDKQKALAELDSAFRLDPGSVGVLRDLGTLSLELADAEPAQKDAYLDRAGKAFKALLMQRLDDSSAITKGEIFYYLAETHHRQGDDKKAIQMLERALDTDKNLEKAKSFLAKLKGG
ncbi:MAG: tetratricopeptide repeat protein [Polyangiaceae bacterium]